MVAESRARADATSQLDHAVTVGAFIDKVAHEDYLVVGLEPQVFEKKLEFARTSVHVADNNGSMCHKIERDKFRFARKSASCLGAGFQEQTENGNQPAQCCQSLVP